MPKRSQRRGEQALLLALSCGATIEVAARTAGLSEATAYRRMQDPEFCRRLQEISADMVGRMAGMLTAAGGEAVKTLLSLLKEPTPASARLGAARAVIEGVMKVREFAALEERLAALEEQAGLNKRA